MKLKTLSAAILFSLFFIICFRNVNAQIYPAKLLHEIPESAQTLNSLDVRERASILKKLVVPVPQSCTGEQDLPVNLGKEDYEFVVGKILESDLSALDYKEDAYIWGKLQFLITKFELFQHLELLTKYLSHPERGFRAELFIQFKH